MSGFCRMQQIYVKILRLHRHHAVLPRGAYTAMHCVSLVTFRALIVLVHEGCCSRTRTGVCDVLQRCRVC